jgi:hypothetical protein
MMPHLDTHVSVAKFWWRRYFGWFLAAIMLLAPAGVHGAPRILPVNAPPVYVGLFSISQNSTVNILTTSLSAGADTVMYLLRESTPGNYVLVASNDDYNYPTNLGSGFAYTNSQTTAYYMLLVRSYSASTTGTCSIQINNVTKKTGAPVNGNVFAASALEYNSQDQFRTAHEPGGSVAHLIAKLTSTTLITGISMGNGVGGASILSASGAPTQILVGTPQIHVIDSYYEEQRSGTTTIMVNDMGPTIACNGNSDCDGDGIGNLLEAALGTCPTIASCGSGAHSGVDTDRDGLSDGQEIWGIPAAYYNDLSLRRWGAKPLKKDIFLELDWLAEYSSAVGAEGPFAHRRANPNHGNYGGVTLEQWVDTIRSKFLAGPADQVKNPDASSGIELHMDLGVAPLNPLDERKFGAWPTSASRVVAFGQDVMVTGPVNGTLGAQVGSNFVSVDVVNLSPATATLVIAHLVDLADTGAAYVVEPLDGNRIKITPSSYATHEQLNIFVFGPTGVNVVRSRAPSPTDELYYNNTSVFDSHRRRRVRYGILASGSGGGAGDLAFASGDLDIDWVHELGHTLGIAHWGHDTWGGVRAQCPPTRLSLMSYAKTPFAFSSVATMSEHLPANVNEVMPLGASANHSPYLQSPYMYIAPTDSSNVDFNRDGAISAAGGRGFGLVFEESSCRAFMQGHHDLQSGTAGSTISGSPDLTRAGTYLYTFWSSGTGSSLNYSRAPLGAVGNKSCTGSADSEGASPCLTWTPHSALATGTAGQFNGVTAAEFGGNVHVVTRNSTGAMVAYRFTVGSGGALSLAGSQSLPSTDEKYKAVSTAELVVRHPAVAGRQLGLLYAANSGVFASFGWDGTTWTWEQEMLNGSGVPILGTQGVAAEAWPDMPLSGWNSTDYMTLALMPDVSGNIRVFKHSGTTNRWDQLAWNPALGLATAGKPVLEHRTLRNAAGQISSNYDGHFLIGWGSPSMLDGNRTYIRISRKFSRSSSPGYFTSQAQMSGDVGDYMADMWARLVPGSSSVLYSDASLDNVFGLTTLRDIKYQIDHFEFAPHADTAPMSPSRAGSDFRIMEDYICHRLNNLDCGDPDVSN